MRATAARARPRRGHLQARSTLRSSSSASLTRRRRVERLWLGAAAGFAFGAGLAIGANVFGVVLAAYGGALAVLLMAPVAPPSARTNSDHPRADSAARAP